MAKYLSVSEESEALAPAIGVSWRRNKMLRDALWTVISLVMVSGVAMLIIAGTLFG